MALLTEADEFAMALEQSKSFAEEQALAKALEDLVIQESEQESEQNSEPSLENILAMIHASDEGAADGIYSRAEPSEEKDERQDCLEDKPVEDTMPPIFHNGDSIFFGCPHCGLFKTVAKGETNCRQFVCVGKSDGTFANPHASRDECMTLLSRGWFGCGEAFTLPEDGSPPIKRAHG